MSQSRPSSTDNTTQSWMDDTLTHWQNSKKGSSKREEPSVLLSVVGVLENIVPRLKDRVKEGIQEAAANNGTIIVGFDGGKDATKWLEELAAGAGDTSAAVEICEAQNAPNTGNAPGAGNAPNECFNHRTVKRLETGKATSKQHASFQTKCKDKWKCCTVTVVAQGQASDLLIVLESVRAMTPIVLVERSGGLADVLVFAYHLLHSAKWRHRTYWMEQLQDLIFAILDPKDSDDTLQKVMECIQVPSLVVVFDPFATTPFKDCVLEGCFRACSDFVHKIKQAIRLDSPKILLTACRHVESAKLKGRLTECLGEALSAARPDFLRICLDAGAELTQQHIEEMLQAQHRELSVDCKSDTGFSVSLKLGKETTVYSFPEGFVNSTRLGRCISNCGQSSGPASEDHSCFCRVFSLCMESYNFEPLVDSKAILPKAFIVAVMANEFELARELWCRCPQPIVFALFARKILEDLTRRPEFQGSPHREFRHALKDNARKFEELAVTMLDKCTEFSSKKTDELLENNATMCGKSILKLACETDALNVIGHKAVHSKVSSMWYGHYVCPGNILWVIVPLLLFPIGLVAVWFAPLMPDKQKDGSEQPSVQLQSSSSNHETTCCERLRPLCRYFAAPIVKFAGEFLTHLLLCILFTYYVLDAPGPELSTLEVVMGFWFGSLTVEELRQACFKDSTSTRKNVISYFTTVWNWLDLMLLILFWTGFCLRVSAPSDREAQMTAKAVHSTLAMFLWIRCLRYYAACPRLGPKLTMLYFLSTDILAFVVLILIFLLGFGVAVQGWLFPLTRYTPQKLAAVFVRPYFQIYGEMALEEISENAPCLGDHPFSDCARPEIQLIPLCLAIYVLITSILLVNLLIAMFNDKYQKVKSKNRQYWRRQNYELLLEFDDKDKMPTPLLAVPAFILSLCRLCGDCDCGKRKGYEGSLEADPHEQRALSKVAKEIWSIGRSSTEKLFQENRELVMECRDLTENLYERQRHFRYRNDSVGGDLRWIKADVRANFLLTRLKRDCTSGYMMERAGKPMCELLVEYNSVSCRWDVPFCSKKDLVKGIKQHQQSYYDPSRRRVCHQLERLLVYRREHQTIGETVTETTTFGHCHDDSGHIGPVMHWADQAHDDTDGATSDLSHTDLRWIPIHKFMTVHLQHCEAKGPHKEVVDILERIACENGWFWECGPAGPRLEGEADDYMEPRLFSL